MNGGAPSFGPLHPPRGWTACLVCLAHSDTGGSTSGHWSFIVWYPLGHLWVEPLTWEPRGGTPLLYCVNDREYATPFLGQHRTSAAGERVVRAEGLVSDLGLLLTLDPSARVIVEFLLSHSGYGSRHLTVRELGDLWDAPILLLDSLSEIDIGALMTLIGASPPSKLLHTGADLLLRAVFRGGWGRGWGREGEGAFGATGTTSPVQPGVGAVIFLNNQGSTYGGASGRCLGQGQSLKATHRGGQPISTRPSLAEGVHRQLWRHDVRSET